MPQHALVTKELADFLGVLAHPRRIRILEELRDEERDVNSLQSALEISHSGVSQHLAVLRAHRLVLERREGRHVFYRLRQPELARWLLDGMRFLQANQETSEVRDAIATVQAIWSSSDPASAQTK